MEVGGESFPRAMQFAANGVGALLGQCAANLTIPNAVSGIDEHRRQLVDSVGLGLDEMHRQPLSRTWADTGQTIQGGDEVEDRLGERAQLRIANCHLPTTNHL